MSQSMWGQPDDEPSAAAEAQLAELSGLVETTLDRARIAVLHPHRLVLTGAEGARASIGLGGVTREALSDARMSVPLPAQATADAALERTLARWAGVGEVLRARVVHGPGGAFVHALQLADDEGTKVTLPRAEGERPIV